LITIAKTGAFKTSDACHSLLNLGHSKLKQNG
jgi:hypothetical protein